MTAPPDTGLFIQFLHVMYGRMKEWDDLALGDPYELRRIDNCRSRVVDLIANLEALL